MQIKALITDFLEDLEVAKNRSPRTIIAYAHYLNRFANFVEKINITSPEEINLEAIRQFRLSLTRLKDEKDQYLSIKTQGYHLISLRSFFIGARSSRSYLAWLVSPVTMGVSTM